MDCNAVLQCPRDIHECYFTLRSNILTGPTVHFPQFFCRIYSYTCVYLYFCVYIYFQCRRQGLAGGGGGAKMALLAGIGRYASPPAERRTYVAAERGRTRQLTPPLGRLPARRPNGAGKTHYDPASSAHSTTTPNCTVLTPAAFTPKYPLCNIRGQDCEIDNFLATRTLTPASVPTSIDSYIRSLYSIYTSKYNPGRKIGSVGDSASVYLKMYGILHTSPATLLEYRSGTFVPSA